MVTNDGVEEDEEKIAINHVMIETYLIKFAIYQMYLHSGQNVFDSISPQKVLLVLLLMGLKQFNVPQRLVSLIRFHEKRKERNFDEKIRYTVRKEEVALRMQRNSKSNHDEFALAMTSWDSNQSWGLGGNASQHQENMLKLIQTMTFLAHRICLQCNRRVVFLFIAKPLASTFHQDISNELYEVDMDLEELREMVVQKCRKISTEEKRKLEIALTKLSPEDLTKALEIVAQNNPDFQAIAGEVNLDMDALSESTLWRLKFFVKDALEVQGKSSVSTSDDNNNNDDNDDDNNNNNNENNKSTTITSNHKKEICEAFAKTAKKRTKKHSSCDLSSRFEAANSLGRLSLKVACL